MNREKKIISLIKETFGEAAKNIIGDDCAVLPFQALCKDFGDIKENLLVSTDAMVEGVHFLPNIEPYYLGWKSVAVNLSDIAAMGGLAKNFFLSASLPSSALADVWLQEFLKGIYDCCTKYSAQLSGGDLTASDKIYLCGTIVGVSQNSKVAKRSFARPGHVIAVTASSQKTLGDSAAGFWALSNNLQKEFPKVTLAHLKPIPRLVEGFALLQSAESPISMMDTSDGLLDCLQQISEQSQVKLVVDLNCLPLSSELIGCAKRAGVKTEEWLLTGGEDYELVATCDPACLNQDWTVIGKVQEGQGIEITNRKTLINIDALKSFDHFC
ncbi:MAG: thiamine-phosphate kinase [Candidatus Caenarcaniphilales bacterium]|nr:thiamine-phosphate kinase [Candidatus Caenarcaniphilales bacterium]